MSVITSILNSPYGYGANNLEQLHCYLTRHVKGVCFSSEEDLYAANVILELQQRIQQLEQQLYNLQQPAPETKPKELGSVKEFNEHERALDTKRLQYCMTHEVFMVDSCIYVNLESETVIDGNFRAALDKLIDS
jgi:hypothetical protein